MRLLLLLATQNADKAPKPAAFEDRLVMMTLMARGLLLSLRENGQSSQGGDDVRDEGMGTFMIDVGVTKKPYFNDKAMAIDESGVYGKDVEQVHLTGFDTLTRIFDRKYYGEAGFEVLIPFLSKHRIRALVRPDDEAGTEGGKKGEEGWGGREEQMEWLARVRRGEREEEGLRREWGERVELVDGPREAEGVSSTRAREGIKVGRWDEVEDLLGREVAGWVREGGLYLEDKEKGKI